MTTQAIQETKYHPDSGDIQRYPLYLIFDVPVALCCWQSCIKSTLWCLIQTGHFKDMRRQFTQQEKALINVLNQRGTDASKGLGHCTTFSDFQQGRCTSPHLCSSAQHWAGTFIFCCPLFFHTSPSHLLRTRKDPKPMALSAEDAKLSLQCQVKRLNPSGKDRVLRNYTAYFHDRCGFPLGSRQITLAE